MCEKGNPQKVEKVKNYLSRLKLLVGSQFFCCIIYLLLSLNSFATLKNSEHVEDSLLAITYNREGIAAARIGDFGLALDYFNRLKKIREAQYGSDSYKLAGVLVNIGIQSKNLGDYENAILNYQHAEELYVNEFTRFDSRLGLVYVNLGTIYRIKGDYLKSYEYNFNALRLLESDLVNRHKGFSLTEYSVAESLFLLKRYNEAIAACNNNIGKVEKSVKTYYTSLLARIYSELKQIDLSKKYYKQTLNLLAETSGESSYDLGLEYTDYVKFLI